MAKYTINYQCGHSEEIQLFGPHADRERKIAYLETKKCPHCINAEILASTDLVGSEKQILWAHKIRETFKSTIKHLLQNAPNQSAADMLNAAAERVINDNKSASWWIDNRDNVDGERGIISIFKN